MNSQHMICSKCHKHDPLANPISATEFGCGTCYPTLTPCDECGIWVEELEICITSKKHELCQDCFEACKHKCVLDNPERKDEIYFCMVFDHVTEILNDLPNIE